MDTAFGSTGCVSVMTLSTSFPHSADHRRAATPRAARRARSARPSACRASCRSPRGPGRRCRHGASKSPKCGGRCGSLRMQSVAAVAASRSCRRAGHGRPSAPSLARVSLCFRLPPWWKRKRRRCGWVLSRCLNRFAEVGAEFDIGSLCRPSAAVPRRSRFQDQNRPSAAPGFRPSGGRYRAGSAVAARTRHQIVRPLK